MKNNRILIITSEFPPLPGGIGNHAFNLAKHLVLNGFEVTVLTDERSKEEDHEFDKTLEFNVVRIPISKPRLFMYFKRIRRAKQLSREVDVVLASGKFSLWLGAIIKKNTDAKLMAVIHGTEVNFKSLFLRTSIDRSLIRFDKVIAVSNFTKNLVKHLQLKSVVFIPNGFDAEDWEINQVDKNVLKGSPKLITVGNITERKGQINVINHLPKLLSKFPNIHYHCLGLPTQKEEFLNRAKELGVEDHITFRGRVAHSQLVNYLNDADIFVMLSQMTKSGDVEGFGIAIIEANYLGIPAIGSVNCGIEDAIDTNNSGLLIDPKDGLALTQAIETILNERIRFQKGARQWAEQHQWRNVIKMYITEIESM